MSFKFCVLLLLWGSSCSLADLLQHSINVGKLQEVLKDDLLSVDIGSIYYAVKGHKLLKIDPPKVCETIKKAVYDPKNVEHLFYLTNAAALSNCLNAIKADAISEEVSRLLQKKDINISELYYSVFSLKALGKGTPFDKKDITDTLVSLIKKEDTASSYGYAFSLCEHMECGKWTVKNGKDFMNTADEIDSKALYFEGGLPVTSMILSSVIRTHKSLGLPTPLTEVQRYKFGEYLVSRRTVATARGATALLEAAVALADDEMSPISVSIKGSNSVTPKSDTVEFLVCDILGRALPGLKPEEVVSQSVTKDDGTVVLSKQGMTPKSGASTIYTLGLSKIANQAGWYTINLSVKGKTGNSQISVLEEISIVGAEIGIGDADGTTSSKITAVPHPNKLKEQLTADHLQKVTLKFSLKGASGAARTAQQVFLEVKGNKGQEVVFIAEPDSNKVYKIEMKVSQIPKMTKSESGVHSLRLILGDNTFAKPISWQLADINFKFGKEAELAVAASGSPLRARRALPEIRHAFRAEEARPARALSDAFACACAAPLLLLLALWARLGVNLRAAPVSLATLLFHVAFAGCLALYTLFWLRLNMFETLRWLAAAGGLALLSGRSLLRKLATKSH